MNNDSPLNELPTHLRSAVEAVRADVIPQDAADRATERALQQFPKPELKPIQAEAMPQDFADRATERARQQTPRSELKPNRRSYFALLASGIAAMLCIASLWSLTQLEDHYGKPARISHRSPGQNPGVPANFGKKGGGALAAFTDGPGEKLRTRDTDDAVEPSAEVTVADQSKQIRHLTPAKVSSTKASRASKFGAGTGGSTGKHPTRAAVVRAGVRAGDEAPGIVIDAPKPIDPNEKYPGVEAYNHFKDNPFLRSVANPLSTFSIAVDTASYSNVRQFLLSENKLPPPDAVRVAELINYFPYQYSQPRGENPVAFHLDLANCPWQPKHHLARIALKGKELDPRQLPARNFVFLIDTSGSMNVPNRLPLLKTSLTLLVEQLNDNDLVSMVAYAGSAGLVLPPTPGNDKTTILKALDRLSAGGSTNGGQGIQLAYKTARESFIQNGINRVILGTDGDFNVGVTNDGDLVRLIEEQRKSGVFLTVLGYGMGNLKDATMERLAHHGSGRFAYIDSLAEARKIFVEQGCSLVTIAKDVKVQVEFNPQLVGAYRLIGYENKLMRAEDFNDDTKFAGDMGSGHTVTALYEIIPAGLPVPGENIDPLKYQKPTKTSAAADSGEWLTVKMRYKDPQADTSKLISQPLMGGVEKLAQAPADFRFAAGVAAFGMSLRNTEHRGTANFAQARDLAKNAIGKDENGHRAEFLKLIDAAAKLTATNRED